MLKCDFNKVAKQFYCNHTPAWVFSCKLLHIFRTPFSKNTSEGLLNFRHYSVHSQYQKIRSWREAAVKVFSEKWCSQKFHKIHWKTPVPGPLFLIKTLAQVFSCEFCKISKNTFLYRTPLVAVSGWNFYIYIKKTKNSYLVKIY